MEHCNFTASILLVMIIIAVLKLVDVPVGNRSCHSITGKPGSSHRGLQNERHGAIFVVALTPDRPREISCLIYLASSATTLSARTESRRSVKIPTTNSSRLCHLGQPSPQTNRALRIKTVKPRVVAATRIFFLAQQQSTGSRRASGTALVVKKNRAALQISAA